MIVYGEGDESESMTLEEYLRSVKYKTIPDGISHAMTWCSVLKGPTISDASNISVEMITSAFSNEKRFVYEFDVHDRRVTYKNAAEKTTSGWVFCGIGTVKLSDDDNDIITPASRQPANTKRGQSGISITNPEKGITSWKCGCWLPGETSCTHLYQYWADRKDNRTLVSQRSQRVIYQYTMAGGMVTVSLAGETPPRDDDENFDHGYNVKLSFDEGIFTYIDAPGVGGADILDQLSELVSKSKDIKNWKEFFGNGGKTGIRSCPWKNHTHSFDDTKLLSIFYGMNGMDRECYIFANSYETFFNGKCLACKARIPWTDKKSMEKYLARDALNQFSEF